MKLKFIGKGYLGTFSLIKNPNTSALNIKKVATTTKPITRIGKPTNAKYNFRGNHNILSIGNPRQRFQDPVLEELQKKGTVRIKKK